jgi:GNAT superfamily N-acetyltransferase
MKKIIIEAPKTGEEKKIENLFKITIHSAFADQGVGHLTEDIANEVSTKMKMLRCFLEGTNGYYFLIAKTADTVVGAISFGSCNELIIEHCKGKLDDVGELGSLYVLPEYQGQGIGSKLINSLINYLKENGIEHFCLDSGFKKAQKKWTRKFGEPYKIVKDLWGSGSDHYFWYCNVNTFECLENNNAIYIKSNKM